MPKGVYPHTHLKPKVYPDDMVAAVKAMYAEGHTQLEIAQALGVTQKVIYRLMANHGIKTRVRAKRDQSGPKNHMWRGDAARYKALHLRVESLRGKPRECKRCGTTDASRYEWANLTGNYGDIYDYERMCVSCHRRYDHQRRLATGRLTSTLGGDAQ